MAYTLKYYKTLSQPDGSNILLEIYEKDGTGASKEIGPVIQILRMDIQGSQNDIDTPIVKTSLTMTFVDAPDHEESSSKKCGNWEEFYTPDSTYWKVVLKSDSSSGSFRQIWGGYVTPDSFSEQLRYRGSVTIIARDNIGHLQDFPFDAEGNEDGMITAYDLVNTAWAKIGSPMSLDWRGEEDNALWLQCNGTDAPSAYMNVSAFEGKNWYEAVEDVLYSMGMVMRYVGNNTVQVSSLRYMQYQGKGDMSALPRIEPKFVAHAQRELAPAAKRIEESVKFELTDGKLAPLADGVLFTGLKGTSPFISENVFGEETIYDIPVWPIANIGDLGWSNVQSRTLFIDPSQYTLSGDMADDAKRMIFIAGNTGNSRAVSFGQRMACRDFRIELQFGRVAERMNNRLSYAWFVWPARFRGYLSVLQNGITQYYNGLGWQAAEYLIDEEIVEGMFAMDVPLSKFVGSAIVKLTIQEIVIGWKIGDVSDGQGLYVAISSLKSAPIKSSLLETNRVNTNYDETNNVIIQRDPSLAPAYNEVPFPQVIKNGIFLIQDGAYVPAKEWAWPGGTPHQMAVYNHLQLLCYYAKPNNVITGDIINADLGDIRALYVWEGKEHLLQGGSLNFLNGRIEGAILREFTRYESLWGAMTRSVAMPEVEESSTTNLESGSSPASDSYDINTEVYLGGGGGTIVIDKAMSDTSQNAVENRVIKAYIDAGDNLIKEEIERLKQQSGADAPSSFYHDMAAIVSHAGMITRQTREQLYNIFSYTGDGEIPSEAQWVIDTNGQHYIVRMLETETGVGFFILGYEGFTRIEGDNTKTNQLLRDKADKKYVDGTFFSQAQFDQIASNQYVVGNVAYQTDSDTGLRRLSLSLGLRIQNDIDAAVNDRPDDNGNYTNGLVTALGVKNWVEGKNYLTSAAMDGYATKEDIKNFVTKGSTLEHYGITDAVISRLGIEPYESGVGNRMGYSYSSKGWKVDGPAMVWGLPTLNARLNADIGSGDNPGLYLSIYNGTAYQWAQIVTDKNFTQFGVKAGRRYTGAYDDDPKSANDINYPSMAGFTSHLADVPFQNGNLLAITTNPNLYVGQIAISADGRIAFRSRTETAWADWRTILHTGNIGDYALTQLNADNRYLNKSTGGTIDGSLTINGGFKVQSQHGHYINFDGFSLTANAGLKVANGYSLSLAGEGITAWEGLKNILGLGSLAYKNEADVAKWSSAISSTANAEIGYGNPAGGWKTTGPAVCFGTTGYVLRLQAATENTDRPKLYASLVYNNTAKGWAELVTFENLADRDLGIQRLLIKGDIVLYRPGDDVTYLNYGAAINDKAMLYTFGTEFRFYISDSICALKIASDKTAYFYGGINLGGKTITSWDDIKASGDYLSTKGGTVSGQIYIKTSSGDRFFRSQSDTYDLGFGIGAGGTNRGIYDFTNGKWWILRGASEHTDIYGTLAVTGAISANGGITLGGETITSWDSLKSGWWNQRLQHATDAPIAIDHLSYINIARTLNSNDNITIEIRNSYSFYMATLIFEIGSTIPNFTLIETSGRNLIWENGINVFNNLEPNTIYKIDIDYMYAAVTTYNR